MCPALINNVYRELTPDNRQEIGNTIRAFVRGTRRGCQRYADNTDRVQGCQLILIPLNTGGHWTLGVIDRRLLSIVFFNTMFGCGRIEKVETVLRFIGGSMLDEDISSFEFHDLSSDIPQQSDKWTCGYHTIRYAKMMVETVPAMPGNEIRMHNASVQECSDFREYLSQLLLTISRRRK